MEFIEECNAYQLGDHLWSGAVDTFNTLVDMGKVDMLDDYFAEIFCDRTPTITEINDILWFESENVFEYCGLDSDGELPVDFDSDGSGVTQKYIDYVEENFADECPTKLWMTLEKVTKKAINGTDYTKVIISFDEGKLTKSMSHKEFDKTGKTLWSKFIARGNKAIILVLDRITRNDLDEIGDFLNEVNDNLE